MKFAFSGHFKIEVIEMVNYDKFSAEMRECFDKLPKLVQESIVQASVEVTSLDQLQNLAGRFGERG